MVRPFRLAAASTSRRRAQADATARRKGLTKRRKYVVPHLTHTRLHSGVWVDFLKRSRLLLKTDDERQALDRLLKYGREQNFWNEFVLEAYHHNQPEAIFLAGIPDLEGTLPHA
jgi:hypothetical protein